MALQKVGVVFVAEDAATFVDASGRARNALGQFIKSTEQGAAQIGTFQQVSIGAFREFGAIATRAFMAVGREMVQFAGDTINVAANYETSLNRFAAVTGNALGDSGFTLQDFSTKFLKLGQDTQYSAQQAADAAVELAKGGISVADVMGGALDATLALAAAGELQLAPAAEIVAKQMAVWGFTGGEAAKVADLLAQAANASTVDVDELALGLANVGGAGRLAGASFQEVVTTMAMIAPGFSSAADAGTSLKTFFTRLQPTTDKATQAMADLGLWTAKAGSVFYDATGKFVGMEEASALLYEATKDLSEEQRILALQTIFEQDALRAAALIAERGATGFNAMGDAMDDAGTAAEQARKRQQGYAYAMEQFRGSVETLQIILGTTFLPLLGSLISNFTSGINTLMTFIQAIQGSSDAFNSLSGPLQTVVNAFNIARTVIGEQGFTSALRTFFTVLEPISPVFGQISDAIGFAAPIVEQFVGFLEANAEPILVSLAAVIGTVVVGAIASFVAAAATAVAPIVALVAIGAVLYKAWTENWFGIRDVVTNVLNAIWSVIQAIITPVQNFIMAHSAEIEKFFTDAWTKIQNIITLVLQIINETIVPVLQGIAAFISAHSAEIQAIIEGVWTFISNIISATLTIIEGVLTAALQIIKGDWSGAWETIKTTLSNAWENIKTAFGGALEALKNAASIAWDGLKELFSKAVQAVVDIVKGIGQAMYDAGAAIVNSIWEGMQAAWQDVKDWFAGAAQDLRDLWPGSEPKDPTSPLRNLAAAGAAVIKNIQEGMQKESFTIPTTLSMPNISRALTSSISPPATSGQIARQQMIQTISNIQNFNLNMNSVRSTESILQDFALARSMAGGYA